MGAAAVRSGAGSLIEARYSDYRSVGGVQLPYRVDLREGGLERPVACRFGDDLHHLGGDLAAAMRIEVS